MDVKALIEKASDNPWDGQPPVSEARRRALAIVENLRGRRGFEALEQMAMPQRGDLVEAMAEIIAGPRRVEQQKGKADGERTTQTA